MRILFLHLSDTHFDNKNKISDTRIEKIVSALQITKHFDECIILFSGDIANSGKSDGYAVAKSFLGFLIDKLKCTYNFTKFINVFIVPGNHDVDYGSCPRNRSAITQYYEENRQDEVIKTQEPKMLTDFFAFSALKKCFCSNPILDQRLLNFNNIKLKVNLIVGVK